MTLYDETPPIPHPDQLSFETIDVEPTAESFTAAAGVGAAA